MSFPDSSVGKESTSNAGDPSSIPGLGRSPGEGIRYPLQYPWAFLVAQLVKNPPAMWETWVLSLGWEDPLEKGKATHSSILAWRIPWTVKSMQLQSRIQLSVFYFHFHLTPKVLLPCLFHPSIFPIYISEFSKPLIFSLKFIFFSFSSSGHRWYFLTWQINYCKCLKRLECILIFPS